MFVAEKVLPLLVISLTAHGHHHRCRLWARRHRNWNSQHWYHVIFADESRFSLYHCHGRARVRRRVGERLVDCCIQEMDGNVGPSLVVWGALHASGNSEHVLVDGTVIHRRYIGILRQNLLSWARATFQRNFVLVHDNVTPHAAWNSRNFLVGEEVEVKQWSARSPDLNPKGHIWDQMGLLIRVIDYPPTTGPRLREALLQAWGEVIPERMEVLVQSMPLWLRAVMAARGGYTRYQLENRKTLSTAMFHENFNSVLTEVHEIWLDFLRNVPTDFAQFQQLNVYQFSFSKATL